MAEMVKQAALRLDAASISFNYFLQESILDLHSHFVLKIEPRPFKYAGAELGTGVIINPIPPEYATLWYRGEV